MEKNQQMTAGISIDKPFDCTNIMILECKTTEPQEGKVKINNFSLCYCLSLNWNKKKKQKFKEKALLLKQPVLNCYCCYLNCIFFFCHYFLGHKFGFVQNSFYAMTI